MVYGKTDKYHLEITNIATVLLGLQTHENSNKSKQ